MESHIDRLADTLRHGEPKVRGFTHGRILKAVSRHVGQGVQRDLATALDVSPATVSKSIHKMEQLGLVARAVEGTDRSGRPRATLRIAQEFAMLGVALVNYNGRPAQLIGVAKWLDGEDLDPGSGSVVRDLTSRAFEDLASFEEQLEDCVLELMKVAVEVQASVLGCGVAVPGHIDTAGGRILRVVGAPRWQTSAAPLGELAARLSGVIGVPVVVENDVTSLAVRNNLRPPTGVEVPDDYALVAPLDLGIGGALTLGGKARSGAHGLAGEAGHLPADGVGGATRLPDESLRSPGTRLGVPVCQCDREGHVEAYAAPRSIEVRARTEGVEDPGGVSGLAGRDRSDRVASLLFFQGGLALGCSVVSLMNWFDPTRVFVYLPESLHRTDPAVAGSYYLRGFWQEVERSAQFEDPQRVREIVRVKASGAEAMGSRLASAAACLVFRSLIQRVSSRPAGPGTGAHGT